MLPASSSEASRTSTWSGERRMTGQLVTAAVVRCKGEPLVIEDLVLDDLRPNETRVRMVASGVCHTDAIVRDGVYPTPLPAVLGHEGAGRVEAVGSAVTTVSPGDHVVLGTPSCSHCNQCKTGLSAYCDSLFELVFAAQREDGSTAFADANGERVGSHFFGQSSFATVSNVHESTLVRVPSDLPLEVMAALGCGLNTGAGAVLNELRPPVGSTFVVIGAGAVGLAAVMAAKVAGCSKIVAVDLHDSRLALAQELGATDVIRAGDRPLDEEIMDLTDKRGVDFALDTTGSPKVLSAVARALAIRGTLGLVGAASPGVEASFEIGASLPRGWTFKTIVQGSSVPQVFIPQMIELWSQGRFPIERLIETYPLEDINQAFADSASGRVIKPIIRH